MTSIGVAVTLRGHYGIGSVDQFRNSRVGEQALGAWTQGLGQRPLQRRAGGVDPPVDIG